MTRVAGAVFVMILLGSGLAGCLGDDGPASAPAVVNNTTDEAPTGLVTDSPEAKANATATGGFQKSLDDRVHFHDAWSGKTELLVMDGQVQAGPSTPPAQVPPPQSYFSTFQGRGVGAATFLLPEGQVILPETKEIVVTITYDTSPTVTGMRLGWKNAAEKRMENASDPVTPGGAVTIPTEILLNDIPHTTVSKWRFSLIPVNTAGPAVWNGTAHVTITLKRDPVLLLSPPHPDHWMENTTLPLLHTSFKATQKWVVFPIEATPSEGFGEVLLPDGVIVPPHTGRILVTINWTNTDTTTTATNPRPGLFYSGANSRGGSAPQDVQISGNTLTATIPVTPEMTDSPYDTVSNWVFYVYLDSDSPGTFGPFGQVAAFDGTIELHLEAVREDKA